jgi:hypothetical protein
LKPTFEQIGQRIEAVGLGARGGFHPRPSDELGDIDGAPVRSLILVGLAGAAQWRKFADSPEYLDGRPDPLDRWSARLIGALAHELAGRALYPFEGPPWFPFQRWARRALVLHLSPLGLLIDPKFGLWHSYRGALALPFEVTFPAPVPWPSPCPSCVTKPCLRACPVDAFTETANDVRACRVHVQSDQVECRKIGCLARRACPVGAQHTHSPAQAAFYMSAFAQADSSAGT